ncbi:MAG: hypothetical protein ACXVAU_05995, partial [Mucilaginibacter sp.]
SIILVFRLLFLKLKNGKGPSNFKFKRIFLYFAGLLLVYSFTYFGDHGLGDEAYLPLGHWETMNAGDGYPYFNPHNSPNQIRVDSFLVRGDHLCMASDRLFYDYHLVSGELKQFNNRKLYNAHAIAHSLPLVTEFKQFWPQYNSYWNGWRFWVLP